MTQCRSMSRQSLSWTCRQILEAPQAEGELKDGETRLATKRQGIDSVNWSVKWIPVFLKLDLSRPVPFTWPNGPRWRS